MKNFVWTGVKTLHLDGCQNTLFGPGFEKLCLDGCQNLSVGLESKNWTLGFFSWTGVEICLLDQGLKIGLWNFLLDECKKILLGGPEKLIDNFEEVTKSAVDGAID